MDIRPIRSETDYQAALAEIEALFERPGRAFVVVGAAHLVGPDGLLHMLRAKGYTVEQM